MPWLPGLLVLASLADSPHAVAVWPAGPLEVRVALDRPIEASVAKRLVETAIPFGPAGRPAEGSVRIAAARLADQGRTLVLATDPHPRAAVYHLKVPVSGATHNLVYDLTGVEVSWFEGGEEARPAWSGWWPHVEPDRARTLTEGSVEHAAGFALLTRPGKLRLRTVVALPEGEARLSLESDAPFEATLGGQENLTIESTGEPVGLEVALRTGVGGNAPSLRARSIVKGQPRTLERKDLLLPWVPPPPPEATEAPEPPFDLKGGDAWRGEAVFFGETAKCSNCHKIHGKGGKVGPDLSELGKKNLATIYRDIADPSTTIDPAYLPFTVALKNGQVAVGIVRAEGADVIRVLDVNGKATVIRRTEIEELRPSGTSIMPVGLVGGLGEEKVRDLIAFLRRKS
jgi:putative heme-binding domain-containing protein